MEGNISYWLISVAMTVIVIALVPPVARIIPKKLFPIKDKGYRNIFEALIVPVGVMLLLQILGIMLLQQYALNEDAIFVVVLSSVMALASLLAPVYLLYREYQQRFSLTVRESITAVITTIILFFILSKLVSVAAILLIFVVSPPNFIL